jgi:hypothetical protein
MDGGGLKGTGTASIRVKDINDMPPSFTKGEWVTEVDETDGNLLPDAPILTVTVHDEDESNKFHYKETTFCFTFHFFFTVLHIRMDLTLLWAMYSLFSLSVRHSIGDFHNFNMLTTHQIEIN